MGKRKSKNIKAVDHLETIIKYGEEY